MSSTFFLQGLIIGFSVAAPVGPIGVLTIKRTLNEGRLSGFMTGMGAAFADSFYGAVAGFGLTAISAFLMTQAFWMKLIGGIFLLYLGVKSLMSKPATKEANAKSKSLLGNLVSTFFLTVTNPATIISFLAIFTALGLGTATETNYSNSALLVGGVFLGSALWWFILSTIVGMLQSRITPEKLIWVNRLSGLIIILFGVWALYSAVFPDAITNP